jgi:magnesium transporter
MVKKFTLSECKVVECGDKGASILVYLNPDAAELKQLEAMGIDSHNLASAMDPDELGRAEFEPDHVALILKRPKNYSSEDDFLFKIMSMGLFLFKDKLVLVRSDELFLFEGKLFTGLNSLTGVMLKIFYSIISHFLSHLKVISMISDSLEQKINQSMENKYLFNMFTLEKSLVYYLNATNSNAAVIDKLKINASKFRFNAEDLEFVDDLIIESHQCAKQAEIHSNVLASLMDARASIVNNNLNVWIKQLTLISIVFMPLNVIAGIGGMSEFSMMTHGIPWPIAYACFTIGLIPIGFITYWVIVGIGPEGRARRTARRKVRT